jgi:hypothetical protein
MVDRELELDVLVPCRVCDAMRYAMRTLSNLLLMSTFV